MIVVKTAQKWLCVKTKRRGTMIEIVGPWRGANSKGGWLYRNLSSSRSRQYGRVTEAELRRNYELRNCDHEPVIDDCSVCWCPFHGVKPCECAPAVTPC